MWFLGLVLGMILGGIAGGGGGAAAGAFFGAIGGWILGKSMGSANRPAVDPTIDARLNSLQQAVEDIHWRLQRIEQERGLTGSPMQAVAATADAPDAPVTDTTNAAIAESNTTAEEIVAGPSALPPPNKAPAAPNAIQAWLGGGNTIVRVGVLILFIGVAFLVKYAAEHAMFPLELRLAAVAAGAVALLVVGWRLRSQPGRAGYALTLQGAGIAILYLTVFAALRLYGLIPAALAFPLLVGIAACSALLAIRQDALVLAVVGAAGGFLAPILASAGGGSHVTLFSYYAVLNAGIFYVAAHKAWRPLNLVGFGFTFVIGLLWGAKYYQPEFFSTTALFLVLFFVAYVAIAVMYAFKQAPRLTHYVDGTLIFGVPIVGFGLQAGLVKDFEYGLAFSSLALAGFYLLLATWLHRKMQPQLKLLIESFLALGVIFATLTIPLALDARWTSAAWALEGAAVFWVGVRQDRRLARAFGLLLQLLAGAAFLNGWQYRIDDYLLVNRQSIGALLLTGSAWFLNRLISRHRETVTQIERGISPVLFVWGLAWWLAAGFGEINHFVAGNNVPAVALLFITATVVILGIMHRCLDWREAAWPQRALLPALIVMLFFTLTQHRHLFAHGGWVAWPLALLAHFWLLKALEPNEPALRRYFAGLHCASLLLLAAIGAIEIHWLTGEWDLQKSAWSVAAAMLVPGLLAFWVSTKHAQNVWPVREFPQSYWLHAGVPLIIALGLWSLYANFTHNGQAAPLPYLPLLNALDLAHVLVLLTLATWWRRVSVLPDMQANRLLFYVIAAALSFIWLNAILLRTLHHWADVPYRLEPMLRSLLVQASLSIFWTLLSLAMMLFAARQARRGVWMSGAALMAVVVGKLLLVDLSHLSGVERIVSFIGVGVLMLVVGYVAPVPPAAGHVAREPT